ncbi:MAG: hypothetical protein JWN04_2176, partial [Myxococcaceae bacterium]|nr:hypothetical protein [Myxococcaceae bacterium]
LEWQRGISDIVATFDEASSYCTKAGFRVPTYKELLTLADPGIEDSLPIDALFAQDDPFALLWSSTQHWVGGTLVYSVMMAATDRDSDANTMLVVNGMTYTTNLRVRCVR